MDNENIVLLFAIFIFTVSSVIFISMLGTSVPALLLSYLTAGKLTDHAIPRELIES